ncbi:MAG TPA: hypothetical protein VLF69_04615, partial [Candidatus Saccharimonadales bacterium]|nr:hypothetical protein [Candidatus Saccharimonadales bacterium]
DNTSRTAGAVSLTAVGVLVNRLGRSIKHQNLPQPGDLPPMINENATRSLAHYKHRANAEVLAPLGIGMPTVLVETPDHIASFTATHGAEEYIVKPNTGTFSRGVQRVAVGDLSTIFSRQSDLYGTQILQPAYNFSQPFPSCLRPYDAASAEEFEGWRNREVPKELRIYGFHAPGQTTVFPVARALDVDGDHWLFVDPESVPLHLLERTAMAVQRVADISGAIAVAGTVDYGFGTYNADDPDWRAIELNGRSPYLIGYAKHRGVADRLRTLFAAQIAATAFAVRSEMLE